MRKKSVLREYTEAILVAVLLALLIRTFVVQAFKIPSGSMIPTLLVGDHILVNKFIYQFTDPKRGDVIVFKYPVDESRDFIKRIIAVGGEDLYIKDQKIYVNCKPPDASCQPIDDPWGKWERGARLERDHVGPRAAGLLLRDGRQPEQQPGQPLLGLRQAREDQGPGLPDLLVLGLRAGRRSGSASGGAGWASSSTSRARGPALPGGRAPVGPHRRAGSASTSTARTAGRSARTATSTSRSIARTGSRPSWPASAPSSRATRRFPGRAACPRGACSSAAARRPSSRPRRSRPWWPTPGRASGSRRTPRSRSRRTPRDSTADRLRAFRAAGVTRLSLGVQALDDALLRRLGRTHSAADAEAAYRGGARGRVRRRQRRSPLRVPRTRISTTWARTLDAALAWDPDHLSAYALTLEPATPFGRRPPAGLPDEDLQVAQFDTLVERAARAGLERYEVSNFARPGRRSRHNLGYWRRRDYIGLGPGAHGAFGAAPLLDAALRAPLAGRGARGGLGDRGLGAAVPATDRGGAPRPRAASRGGGAAGMARAPPRRRREPRGPGPRAIPGGGPHGGPRRADRPHGPRGPRIGRDLRRPRLTRFPSPGTTVPAPSDVSGVPVTADTGAGPEAAGDGVSLTTPRHAWIFAMTHRLGPRRLSIR